MRLGDVARAIHQRGQPGLREQRGLGPEVDRVADRQAEFVRQVARGEPAFLGAGDVAGRQRGTAEGLLVLGQRGGIGKRAELRVQRIHVLRGQRPEAEADLGARRDHVGLDAALDPADVEAQPGQPAEAQVMLGLHVIECGGTPAHRVVQRAQRERVLGRGMARLPLERHPHRADAPVRQHRLALGGLGDDGFGEAVVAGKERRDATRIIGFLVAGEQERGVTRAHLRRCDQSCRGALDVARTQANRAIALDPQLERIAGPRRRRRHRVQVDVEHPPRLAAHGEQRHRAGTVIDHLDIEVRQLRADVVEDATGGDRARWIAGVVGHQLFEMLENLVKHGGALCNGRWFWIWMGAPFPC